MTWKTTREPEPVFLTQNVALNSDAAQNYKYSKIPLNLDHAKIRSLQLRSAVILHSSR